MPRREQFVDGEYYYATLFHELTHATGHEKRLARKEVMAGGLMGDDDYSKEELVAEMGSAFLCGHCGIATRTIADQAAYIHGWMTALADDHRLIIQAAASAQKAADYILRQTGEAAARPRIGQLAEAE